MNEKGIIFDLIRYAVHDGPGIRTTVFLKGCPLDCVWCHNPESKKITPERTGKIYRPKCRELFADNPHDMVGKEVPVAAVMYEIRKDTIFYDQSGGGVTFSGGEPLMQQEFLAALLAACRENEIHTAVDTSGYSAWKNFDRILEQVDLFLFDLKIMDNGEHIRYTGVPNLLIHENLKRLSRTGKQIIIRVPLIPAITDTRQNLSAIRDFVNTLDNLNRIDLLPYNILSESKPARFGSDNKLGHLDVQTEAELNIFKSIFDAQGMSVKIGG